MTGADVLAERMNIYEYRVRQLEAAQDAANRKLGEIESTLNRIKWTGYGLLAALGLELSGTMPLLKAWIALG